MDLSGGDGKLTGDMLTFYIDGQALACETSCDFSFNVDMKSISPYMAGGWQQVIPGIRSWQMSVNANFISHFKDADFKTILGALLTRKQFTIAMRTQSDYAPAFTIGGSAFPSSGSLTSSGNDLVGYSTIFTGNGPLIYSSEASDGDFWRVFNTNPAEADKPLYVKSDA